MVHKWECGLQWLTPAWPPLFPSTLPHPWSVASPCLVAKAAFPQKLVYLRHEDPGKLSPLESRSVWIFSLLILVKVPGRWSGVNMPGYVYEFVLSWNV